ncbi:hypothetical protein FCM35_KLT10676 [Carex littledalei]|uniref:CCHC-type domain-containing protein n=1 Tax=Carex littledalei TaxID=544730 RepID=A0A833QL76_9POAL|nr:hypothetical protein FCM35_KLT10676 [Carex littledalei]
MIRRRFGEMKHRSTTVNHVCYRCGSPEHLATDCRNSQKCLVCKEHGQQSHICTSKAFRLPPNPHKSRPSTAPPLTTDHRSSSITMAGIRNLILLFNTTMESEARLGEFSRSFILSDVAKWGPDRIDRRSVTFFPT